MLKQHGAVVRANITHKKPSIQQPNCKIKDGWIKLQTLACPANSLSTYSTLRYYQGKELAYHSLITYCGVAGYVMSNGDSGPTDILCGAGPGGYNTRV